MQTEQEEQFNADRERKQPRTCRATQVAVSTSVPHVHRCVKYTTHKLRHSCVCFYEWDKE